MNKYSSRTPKNYDGTAVTTHRMHELLPHALERLSKVYRDQPTVIMSAWAGLLNPQHATMTRAIQFKEGVLWVNVNNPILYALLCQHEKLKLLRKLRAQFPTIEIKNIAFRRGEL